MADEKEKLEQMKIISGETKVDTEDIEQYYERISKTLGAGNEKLKERLLLLKNEVKLLQDAAKIKERDRKLLEEEISLMKEGTEKKKKQLELQRAILEDMRKRADIDENALRTQQRIVDEINKELQLEDKLLKKREESLKKVTTLFNSMTGGVAMMGIKMFTFDGFLSNFLEKFTALDKAQADFAASTGKIANVSTDLGIGIGKYGLGLTDVIKSHQELYNSMSSFSNLDKKTQGEIAQHTAIMGRFGIAASTAGKNYDILTKGIGYTTNEVTGLSNKLMQHAIGAGIAPKKMVEEFASAAPKLAAYGKKSVDVYIDLQKAAKSLGMEMSALTTIVGDQWDTFEGSARSAGKLNAVLGGNFLNSVEMLNATESERAVLIKESMEASGKQFDTLDKFEKKALASTIGISNLDDATKFFNGSVDNLKTDMEKQAETQTNMLKAQEATATQMEKMSKAFEGMNGAVQEFINFIKPLTEWANSHPNIALYAAAIALLGPALMSIIPLFKGLLGSVFKLPSLFKGVFTAAAPAAQGMGMMGTAATMSAGQIMAFGVAVALVGVGIAAAALGLAELVKAFKGLNWIEALGAIGGIVAVMWGMAAVIGVLIPELATLGGTAAVTAGPLIALGAAFLLMGAGIGAAAWGIGKLAEGLGKLIHEIMGGGLMGILKAFAEVLKAPAEAVSILTTSIGSLFDKISWSNIGLLAAVAKGIDEITEALESMPTDKSLTIQTLKNTVEIAKSVKAEEIKPATDFIQTIKQYYEVQTRAKGANEDAVIAALRENTKALSAGKQASDEPIKVKLVITDGSFGNGSNYGGTSANALLYGFSPSTLPSQK